jgi:hypothetical protein
MDIEKRRGGRGGDNVEYENNNNKKMEGESRDLETEKTRE